MYMRIRIPVPAMGKIDQRREHFKEITNRPRIKVGEMKFPIHMQSPRRFSVIPAGIRRNEHVTMLSRMMLVPRR